MFPASRPATHSVPPPPSQAQQTMNQGFWGEVKLKDSARGVRASPGLWRDQEGLPAPGDPWVGIEVHSCPGLNFGVFRYHLTISSTPHNK